MTFDEAIAAPGRKVQLWPDEVRDGNRIVMIYSLGDDGAKRLAVRDLPDAERGAVAADLSSRGIAVAEYDFYCLFVWVTKGDGIEVFDDEGRVFEAVGDRATLEDGRVIARADIGKVIAFANDDHVWRGVKAVLRSGGQLRRRDERLAGICGEPGVSVDEESRLRANTIGAHSWPRIAFTSLIERVLAGGPPSGS